MSLAGGAMRLERQASVSEALDPGLKLVLMLDGELAYRVPGAAETRLAGPMLHLSLCRSPLRLEHEFGHRRELRFVSLRTSLDHLRDTLGIEPGDVGALLRARAGSPTPICAPATPCRRWAGRCWPARRKGRCAACICPARRWS